MKKTLKNSSFTAEKKIFFENIQRKEVKYVTGNLYLQYSFSKICSQFCSLSLASCLDQLAELAVKVKANFRKILFERSSTKHCCIEVFSTDVLTISNRETAPLLFVISFRDTLKYYKTTTN